MELNDLLKNNFENWLQTLGYAESTVLASSSYVRDFFFYLKNRGVTRVEKIKPGTVAAYLGHLQKRGNKRRGGGLSANYIVSNINALKRFASYLRQTGKGQVEIRPGPRPEGSNTHTIFTKAEIKALYKACGQDGTSHAQLLALRDKAMLGIYYGCGLRRSEGQALDLKDILWAQGLVHVRKGKNYKERYVPMTKAIKEDLENYVRHARDMLLIHKGDAQGALFISNRGRRQGGHALLDRLHKLVQVAGIQKQAGLHTLRHSIATHLLWSGMELEDIARFLGHSSLGSTQIYTHIANELADNQQQTKHGLPI